MLRQGQLVRSVDLSDGSGIKTVAQSGGPAFHTCVPPATEQNWRCIICISLLFLFLYATSGDTGSP